MNAPFNPAALLIAAMNKSIDAAATGYTAEWYAARKKRNFVWDDDQTVYARDNGLCPSCMEADHMIPCPDAPGYELCESCGEVS